MASREAQGSTKMVGSESLVTVRGLRKYYPFRAGFFGQIRGVKHAVDGVDLDIREGETLGLVGESGSGKTTIGYSILSLVRPTSGSVYFDGKDVAGLRPAQLKAARKEMQIVFENPLASLNPRMTIIEIVSEGPIIHRLGTPVECRERAVEALRMVGIDSELLDRLPGELSGGQQQRVCIARALALRPRFIMADEPVSSLDASIRADVLNLLTDLQTDLELTMLFIAHDLRVIKHIADRVAVLYLGRIVELARRDDLFSNPLHPYTVALISAAPALEPDAKRERVLLPGEVPSVIDPPRGCRFHPRCPIAVDRCAIDEPALVDRGTGHWVSCWLAAGA
jgi:oligopeptide/dipeptide ABC transporter ATP-binding protein